MRATWPGEAQADAGKALTDGDGSGTITSSTEADGDGVRFLGKIDTDVLEKEFGKLNTDEVVITNERLLHIQQRHPEDYELFNRYGEKTVLEPDVILRDNKNDNTVFMIAKTDSTNLNTIVRLSVSKMDPIKNINSIMTFYRIREKNLKKLMERNKILYKKRET